MTLPHDIVQALVKTIELKDLSTAAHTWRVVLYTRALAEALGVPHDRIERLTVGAALHDVGKIDIPDAILQKPDKLTEAEFEVIKTHPVLGHERLVRMGEDDPLVLELVRHHHERQDGRGYPDRLPADRVPMAAKYFAVVDTFDALTSVRPYRRAVGPEAGAHAIRELEDGIGSRYCADCVRVFSDLYRRGHLGWILAHFNDQRQLDAFGPPARIAEVTRVRRPA